MALTACPCPLTAVRGGHMIGFEGGRSYDALPQADRAVCALERAGDFIDERGGQILKCAWHEWEFDIRSGRALLAEGPRVKPYPITVEDSGVILHLG